MRCRHISTETKHTNKKHHKATTTCQCGPSIHLRNTPGLAKASTTETATAPAADQRTARRPHITARARSSPDTRMNSHDAPSKQYAATVHKPINSEYQTKPASDSYDTTTCARSRPCANAVRSEPSPKPVTQRPCN